MNTSDEWELSKENVQPLKHGRKVTSLTAALQPHNVDQHQQLIRQRQSMEAALRSYTGDDPLEPWDAYVKWTEQAYPNGGKDSNLQVLLEKCLAEFKNDARYKNDVRYVSCWIKLANNFLNNPLEIFQFMRDQAIGIGLSMFYEAWSWELEQLGSTKKADAVFREGLAYNAQPREKLEAAHRDFQSRVARATMNKIQEGENDPGTQTEQREHLADLRAKGRHQKVSSQRVGAAKQASKGGLGVALPTPQVGQSFSVFCDSEQGRGASSSSQSSLPAPTGEWERIPVRREAQKENLREPGPWVGQKVRQHRTAGIGISEAATFAQPSFKVHVDESGPEMTPRKMPEMGNQVLSARKPEKPSNLLQNIVQQPVADDKTRAMYCKHLIYSGANEMSFEELRAIKYNAKREAKKLEEERAALERQRAEYQAMVRQQQEAMEQQILQQRLLHQQQLDEQRRAQQQLQQQLELQMQQQIQQQQQQMQQQLQHMQQQLQQKPAVPSQQLANVREHPVPVQQAAPQQQGGGPSAGQDSKPGSEQSCRDPTVTRQLMYEDTGNPAIWMSSSSTSAPRHPTPSSIQTDSNNSHLSTSQITPGTTSAAAAPNVSQTRTPVEHANPTPGSSHSRNTSGLSLSRMTPSHTPGGLTRPSPTVHTKEAMNLVMAMLNNPLGDDDDFMWGSGHQLPQGQRDNNFEAIFANTDSQKSKLQTFPDFQTSSGTSAFTAVTKGTSSGPAFTIFNESEAASATEAVKGLDSNDDYEHLDNQENMPPKDYVKPRPDGRQKLGILQPAQGIPFMPLEEQERLAREEDQKASEEADAMEGIEPLKPDPDSDSQQPPDATMQHSMSETILHPQGAHSAFKAASRMASTPFTSSGVLSFPPLSSIKPSLLGADGEAETPQPDASGDGGRSVGRPVGMAGRVLAASNLESFEATECTMNADSQQKLSPIMERSNEDTRSSASSSSNSAGSSHLSSTTHAGASSTSHAGLSTTHAGLSPTCAAPSSTLYDSRSTSRDNFSTKCDSLSLGRLPALSSTHDGLSTTHPAPFSTFCGPSSTASHSFSTASHVSSPPAIPRTSILGTLDESYVSVRRGHNHLNRTGSHKSLLSQSSHRQHSNEVDDSVDYQAKIPTTSASFQVFEDAPLQIGTESVEAFSRPSNDILHETNDEIAPYAHQLHRAVEDTRPFLEEPASKVFGASVFEDGGKSFSEIPTSSHQLLPSFNRSAHASESLTDPGATLSFQSSRNEEIRVPVDVPPSHEYPLPQQQASQELGKTDRNLPDVSLDPSTLLMSKLHLGVSEDSIMETDHHQNTSLMECSVVPDDPNDGPASTNIDSANIDPFSVAVQTHLLNSLSRPLSNYEGFAECDYPMPDLVPGQAVGLSDKGYAVEKLTGEGAFAKVYQAVVLSIHTEDHSKTMRGEDDKVILKVQQPACPWEFYISRALHERLGPLGEPVDVRASLMYANNMHVFPNGSCLVTQHHPNLTLLDAVNEYNRTKAVMPEPLLLLFTIEILHVVEQMHGCDIIHGDIKPDNFLLLLPDDDDDDDDNDDTDNSSRADMTKTKHVKLIDFGRSIDMRLFPKGTTFRATCGTDGFMCPEMQSGRPWTYQTDLFGVAATVHCLMFGSYMKVYEEKGRWKHTSNIKRYYTAKWKQFFDTLLNIPSCDALPSLRALRRDLEATFAQTHHKLDAHLMKLATMLFPK